MIGAGRLPSIRPHAITARVAGWRPRIGEAHEAWPGITIAGIVIVAAAVLADALGDPPRGGPRFYIGLGLGLVVLIVGYALRYLERRNEGDGDAP
jgi:hypothetical protein